MSDIPVQKGETLLLGFGVFAYTGYMPEDGLTWKSPADIEAVKDENNATLTKIITDPRNEFEMTLLIKSTGSITPPKQGDTVTLIPPGGTSTAYRCRDASVELARGISKLKLSLIKEASMTYS